MKTHSLPKSSSLKFWASVCAGVELLVAALVLVGWQFNIQSLKYPIAGLAGMNPLTALCFLLLGIAFFFLKTRKSVRYIPQTLSAIVIGISLFKLVSGFIPSLPQIDRLFYPGKIILPGSGQANTMATTTALCFILSGFSLLLVNYERHKKRMYSHYLAVAVLMFAFFILLGYLYGANEFHLFVERFPMAVHTAGCFLLISIAILFVYPTKGITREFTSTVTGHVLGRSLFFGAILIPVLLGWVRTYFMRTPVISPQLSLTFFVFTIIIIFCFLTFYFLIQMNQKESLRTKAEEQLRQSEALFRTLVSSVSDYAIFMLDVHGNIMTWNTGAENIKGYKEKEIKGKHISVFYTPEDREKGVPEYILKKAKEEGGIENEGWRVRKDGSRFWADVVITALYNDHGNFTGYAKVTRDTTENKKAKDLLADFNRQLQQQVQNKTNELQEITSQLRQLAAYLQTAREDERSNIAREIHDELGQMLTGLRMDLVWLRKKLVLTDNDVSKRFEGTLELLNDAKQTLRRISRDLHPAVLRDLGLVAALKILCKDFESRSGISVNFTTNIEDEFNVHFPAGISIGLYRILQESLNNVAKHAFAKKVVTSLTEENHYLILDIRDDGKGFDLKEIAQKKTLGLISIRERVIMMDGKYQYNSSPGKGTSIHVSVPFKTK